MLRITDATSPTLEEVTAKLDAGEIETIHNGYAHADLEQAYYRLLPVVWRYRADFEENGYRGIKKKLVECHRFLQISGESEAERRGITSEQRAATEAQGRIRKRCIDRRDAAVRMARIAGTDPRLFSVNFGQGDAAHVLGPARVFLALLERHGDKLGNAVVVEQMLEEHRSDIDELVRYETAQEVAKKEAMEPSGRRQRARDALYAHLLFFSRAGFVVFRYDEETRALFSLQDLRKGTTRTVAVDDDDAPVLPLSADEAEVEVPPGNVVELAAPAEGAPEEVAPPV